MSEECGHFGIVYKNIPIEGEILQLHGNRLFESAESALEQYPTWHTNYWSSHSPVTIPEQAHVVRAVLQKVDMSGVDAVALSIGTVYRFVERDKELQEKRVLTHGKDDDSHRS